MPLCMELMWSTREVLLWNTLPQSSQQLLLLLVILLLLLLLLLLMIVTALLLLPDIPGSLFGVPPLVLPDKPPALPQIHI